MELLEKVAEVFRTRQEKRAGDFDSLVVAVADGGGKAPSPEAIAERLEKFGKSLSDLSTGVKELRGRRESAAVRDGEPALLAKQQEVKARVEEVCAQYAAAESVFAAARSEYLRNLDTLSAEQRRVDDGLLGVKRARESLISTYPASGPLALRVAELQAEQVEAAEPFRASGFNLDTAAIQRRAALQDEIDRTRESMGAEPA